MTRRRQFRCPACHVELAPAFIRKAANSIAGSAKRPAAKGIVRNPKGRSKKQASATNSAQNS